MTRQDDPTLDWTDELDELGKEYQPEWGLPLRSEGFSAGIPRVTADYLDFDSVDRESIARLLLEIEHVVSSDCGSSEPCYYVFESAAENAVYDPRTLIGIVTFRGNQLRIETSVSKHTVLVRAAVERVLGGLVRHRAQVLEDPFEDCLTRP